MSSLIEQIVQMLYFSLCFDFKFQLVLVFFIPYKVMLEIR